MSIEELVHSGKGTISLYEAAELFGVDRRTLGKEIKAGTVQAIQFGNRPRIPVPPLLALLGVSSGGRRYGE